MRSQISPLFSVLDQIPPDEVVQDIRIEGGCVALTKISGSREIFKVTHPNVTVVTLVQDSPERILERTYEDDIHGEMWIRAERVV